MNLKNWFNRIFRRQYLDIKELARLNKKGITVFA